MTVEDFKNLTEGVQAIAVTLAVVAGGAWACFRFWTLQELRKSKAELEKATRELERRGTLNLSLSAQQITSHSSGFLLEIHLSVANIGNRTEVLDLERGIIQTARVCAATGQMVEFDRPNRTPFAAWGVGPLRAAVAPGETKLVPALATVPCAGVYYVSVAVPGSPEETSTALSELRRVVPDTATASWGALTCVTVRAGDLPPDHRLERTRETTGT